MGVRNRAKVTRLVPARLSRVGGGAGVWRMLSHNNALIYDGRFLTFATVKPPCMLHGQNRGKKKAWGAVPQLKRLVQQNS